MADDIPVTIICKYSCELCGLQKREVEVPARDPDRDVVRWLETVVRPALVADHESVSPGCRPESLKDLWIPLPKDADYVGQPEKN